MKLEHVAMSDAKKAIAHAKKVGEVAVYWGTNNRIVIANVEGKNWRQQEDTVIALQRFIGIYDCDVKREDIEGDILDFLKEKAGQAAT